MEVVIKTEDSSSREEENLHINTNNKTFLEEPLNNNCFVIPSVAAAKLQKDVAALEVRQQNRHYDAPLHPHPLPHPKQLGLNMENSFNNRQQNKQQQQQDDNIPQLHYYNSNNNNNNNENLKISSIGSLNQHYASMPQGTRCGEIFVTRNARKWTFACTFCNKYTRDIGAFVLHLQKMHLNNGAFNDNTTLSGDDDDAEEDELICMNEGNERQEINSTYPSGGVQDQDYVDYSNYLDVSVHTAPDEGSYNNNKDGGNKIEKIKKRGPGRPPGSSKKIAKAQKDHHHNNMKANSQAVIPPLQDDSKIKHEADKLETAQEKHENSQTVANTNGDVPAIPTQEGIDGIEVDGSSSLMDYEHDSTYQDENVWQKFGNYDDEAIADADDDGDGDDDDDFDNQLFMPPPMRSGESSAMAGHSKMKDYIPSVRTVRRQIRGTAYCALCNKTFQYYSLYRNHMTKHSNETPFKCVVCKKGFKSKQAIRYHMHTHEKQKRHKCPLCHAAYYTENQVITHLLTHENGSIFPCMVCGKILHTDSERDQHLTTHTEERPFRCEYCNKLFRLRHHLSNHLKIHRQYRCDYCKTAFTSAVHQRKPYACFACSKHPHVQRQIAKSQSTSSSLSENKDLKPLQILEASMKSDKSMNPEVITGDRSSSSDSSSSSSSTSSGGSSNASNSDAEEHDDPLDQSTHNKIYSDSSSLWENGEEGEIITSEKQRLPCTHCHRTYSNVSALNFHIRNKHA